MNALDLLRVPLAFQGQPPAQSPWLQLVPMVVIFGIFYLLLVAPMRKKQRQLAQTVAALKKGDKVVTTGGLYGEIAGVEGNAVLLKVAENVRVRVAKSAIAGLEAPKEEVSS